LLLSEAARMEFFHYESILTDAVPKDEIDASDFRQKFLRKVLLMEDFHIDSDQWDCCHQIVVKEIEVEVRHAKSFDPVEDLTV
jgi:hypothetical protein